MANVLPIQARKQLLRKFRARFIAIGALIFMIGAIIAALSLLPAFISVRIAQASLESSAQEASDATRDDQAKQARALALVSALQPIMSTSSSPTAALSVALGLKPAGMSITTMSYRKGQIVLSGVSKNRVALNAYREALETDGLFKSVTVPVAALVGAQEGRFTITLTGNF